MQYRIKSVAKSNSATMLMENRVRPLEIKSVACHHPDRSSTLMLVRVGAVDINPASSLLQRHTDTRDTLVARETRNTVAFLAAEVVKAGKPDFSGVRLGDRIVAFALGVIAPPWGCFHSYAQAAFQEYAIVRRYLACPIPYTIKYEQASVFSLTMTVAAYTLFHEDYIYLCPPTSPPCQLDASSDVFIITEGVSGVGLGARYVFDYRTPDLADEIVSAIRADNRTIAGAVAVGIETVEICRRVLGKCKGRHICARCPKNLCKSS